MIVVRHTFQLKPGRAGEFARGMVEGFGRPGGGPRPLGWRVLTDLSGPFDTVVLELELENLAEWERGRAETFAQPEFQEGFARTAEWVLTGRADFYTVEGRG